MSRAAQDWLAAVLALSLAASAHAQSARLELAPGPHFVGSPIDVRVIARDFASEPEPIVSVTAPAHGTLQLIGVSPNVSTRITLINGRLSRTEDVRFVYRFLYLAEKPGAVALGPFTVTQNSVTRSVPAARLQLRTVPRSDRIRVRLELPDGTIYPGERVPVKLELWFESVLRQNLTDYSLRVPLMDRTDVFRFLDPEPSGARTEVELQTAKGPLKLKARSREARIDGSDFVVLTIDRTLVPLRAGSFEFAPASLVADEATAWERDFFGRRAIRSRKLLAAGRAQRLSVQPVPNSGRPASFSGAVGRGFALEVEADRSVVQVGEPITLTFTLRGDGNVESAALPALDSQGLLPPEDFRVPDADLAGDWSDGAKRFTAVVRARHEHVREIPSLEFSWFDPATKRFETARSRPIALAVGSAERIGAADVVRAKPVRAAESPSPGESAAGEGTAGDPIGALDLAIERDPERLLRQRARGGGLALPGALYLGGLGLVALAFVDRRRRDVDPVISERRRQLDAQIRALRGIRDAGSAEAAAEVAAALRRMLAQLPSAQSAELEEFLAHCDARRFAPDAAAVQDGDNTDLAAHALAMALAIRESAP